MDVADFMIWNADTGHRHELVEGEVLPIHPVTEIHGLLVSRLTVRVGMRARDPCQVLAETGLAIPGRKTFYLADVVVTCTPPVPNEGLVRDPLLVIEVMTAATRPFDRGVKVPDYTTVPSIKEIVLVDSARPEAQVWRRLAQGWLVETIPGDATVRLDTTDDLLPLATIYSGLTFD